MVTGRGKEVIYGDTHSVTPRSIVRKGMLQCLRGVVFAHPLGPLAAKADDIRTTQYHCRGAYPLSAMLPGPFSRSPMNPDLPK
jgi:hypothetical protein